MKNIMSSNSETTTETYIMPNKIIIYSKNMTGLNLNNNL